MAALTQLATSLPTALKTQSLQIAIEILSSAGDETYKTEAFAELIPKLTPELLSQALDLALSIKNRKCLKTALSELAPRLTPELLSKALKTFFTSKPYRTEILTALSPYLNMGNLWFVAFESIPSIQDNETRADALLKLAQELPLHPVEETWWTGIFESILSISDGESRSKALAFLAPIIPINYLESALEIALTTWYFPEPRLRIKYDSQALEAIAPRLSSGSILKIIDIEMFKEYINADIESFKLNISEGITQDFLTVVERTLDEVVDLYTRNLPEKTYAQVISVLAPYLTSGSFPQVVETLLDNCSGEELVRALTALLSYYPSVLESAYKAAQYLDSSLRVWALMKLVPYLSKTILQGLEINFKEVENSFLHQTALATLIPYLPTAFSHALLATTQIEDELTRFYAVLSIEANRISLEHLPIVLSLASSFEESKKWKNTQSICASILIHFLPYLPELFSFTWERVLSITGGTSFTGGVRNEDSRVIKTREFISAIPSELVSQALDRVISIKNESNQKKIMTQSEVVNDREQAFILEMLAPRLTLDLLPKALKIALEIIKYENREPVLSALISAFPEAFPLELAVLDIRDNSYILEEDKHRYELLLRTEKNNYNLIYTVAQQFENENDYLKAMTALAPYFPESYCIYSSRILGGEEGIKADQLQSVACHLSEEYLIKSIKTASEIKNTNDKIKTLLEIAKFLSIEHQYRILEVFRTIEQERYQSQALIDLIPLLPNNLFEEVFTIAMSFENSDYCIPVLVAIIPYVSRALPEALKEITFVKDFYDHSQALLKLSKYLPEELQIKSLQKALKIAVNISAQSEERVNALIGLAPHLEDAANYALDAAITYEYFSLHFKKHIESLAPYLKENALNKAFEAAKSPTLYDNHEALVALIPYFPESISETRDSILSNSYIGGSQIRSLIKLAPYLTNVISDNLKAIFAVTYDRKEFVENLEGLVPYLNEEHMTEALNLTQSLSIWLQAFALKTLLPKLSLLYPQVLCKLVEIQGSQPKPNHKIILLNQYWINFLEKLKLRKKINTEIFSKVQGILESIKNESELFYVYVLTELNPNLAQNLMRSSLDKPLIWDFPWDIQKIVLQAFAPCMTQDLLKQILEEDPVLKEKAVVFDYAVRSRHHSLIFTVPYVSSSLFEMALNISMLTDDSDRTEIIKVLLPKLPEDKLPKARQIIDSIQDPAKRTEALFVLATRCPHLLIEVLQSVFSLSPRERRTKQLADLLPYLQQISPTQLFSFWTSSLASMFPYSRSNVLEKVDVLAPLANQLAGDEAIEAMTGSIDCVTRWWR